MSDTFISCDWGTTRLRLRAVRIADLAVLAEFRSLDGVAELARQCAADDRPLRYRTLLSAGIRELASQGVDLEGAVVVISGMAGSSIGWEEVPYAGLPLALDASQLAWRELEAPRGEMGRHRVALLSGVCSTTDVMRGEETELVGLFALAAAERHTARSLVIKPGTHSKHVRVEHHQIVGFQTFMTGELHEVLGAHSVLAHSIGTGSEPLPQIAVDDLRAGVRHALVLPLAAALFRVRTRQLLDNLPHERNRAFLSGVLVGSELAYLTGREFAELPLLLCATAPLEAHYRAALEELGLGQRLTVIPPVEVETLSVRGQATWGRSAGWF